MNVSGMNRRHALAGLASLPLTTVACAKASDDAYPRLLGLIEKNSGGRLGVGILDTKTGHFLGHRARERFTMCSTFKMPLAAAILMRSDSGQLDLGTVIKYTKADMVPHAPVTGPAIETGLSIRALAEAAQKQSDNVAANLLLKQIGGPQGFTDFLRMAGDQTTRLDRFEPELNTSQGDDQRDTTTPEAMARVAGTLLTSALLRPSSRELLIQWMVDTQTGLKRIRAGLPREWRTGDKTGTATGDNFRNKCNDVAIVIPPGRAPVIVAAYFESRVSGGDTLPADEAVLAEVGKVAADWIRDRA